MRYYTQEDGGRIVLFDRQAIVPDRPIYETHIDNRRKMLDDCEKLNKAHEVRMRLLGAED
jgi:hypothetical protein